MVRRIASQVHKQASRLTRAGFLKTPPVWYEAVLEHPPLPLPAREPPSRTSYDSSSKSPKTAASKKTQGSHPLPITYVEDDIRRQFFRDHPFEAFRPRTLTESGSVETEHPANGLKWTRLNQRGRNPSSEEYVDSYPCATSHISFLISILQPTNAHFLAQCNSPLTCTKPMASL